LAPRKRGEEEERGYQEYFFEKLHNKYTPLSKLLGLFQFAATRPAELGGYGSVDASIDGVGGHNVATTGRCESDFAVKDYGRVDGFLFFRCHCDSP
jgi:hypothetical protein